MMFIRTILALSLVTFSLAIPVAQSDDDSGLPTFGEDINSFNEGGTELGSGTAHVISAVGSGAVRLVGCGLVDALGNEACGK